VSPRDSSLTTTTDALAHVELVKPDKRASPEVAAWVDDDPPIAYRLLEI